MLIEFSVENHRAFREKQTFSMVASATTERTGHDRVLETGFSVVPRVLSGACIFGANGAGKSSLINAMNFMCSFVKNSFQEKNIHKQVPAPFKFHSKWRKRPSKYEVSFVHKKTLFQYGFVRDGNRVIEEWLFARSSETQRARQLFYREFDCERDTYLWELNPEHLRGKRESWRDATRPDALFLTTAAYMNAEALQAPCEWFSNILRHIELEGVHLVYFYASYLKEDEWKQRILKFMAEADVALSDLDAKERETSELTQKITEMIVKDTGFDESQNDLRKIFDVNTFREDDEGSIVPLSMREESRGTRTLFNLAVPILKVLDDGLVLFVDDLNAGLHPLVFNHLVSLFADPKSNPKGAQLIFTTHETSVFDQRFMGRDQIWLVEKNDQLAAKLVPLSDFRVRDAKAFQKKYLDGRFGGVPKVRKQA